MMKKVITFLFLVNLVAAIAWFNYQVYYQFTDSAPVTATYQEPKDHQWTALRPAQQFFQKNIILDLLLKRM